MLLNRLRESDFIRKIIGTFAAQFFLLALNFLSAVFISRALGPTLRGMFAVAIAVSSMGMQFGNLGLHSANTFFSAREPKLLPAIVGNTLATSVCLGGLCAIATWLFCLWDSQALLEGPLLILAVLWIPFGLAYMLFQNVLLGIDEVKAFNYAELLNRICNFLLLFSLISLGSRNISLLFLASYGSLGLALLYVAYKIKGRLEEKPYLSSELFKRSVSYAIRVYIGCLIAFVVIRCDVLFVKHYLGFEQAGYYAVAASAIDIISMFPMTVGTLLFPKLAALNEHPAKLAYLRKIGFTIFLIMAVGALLLFVLAKPLISLLYGAQFLPVVPIFLWLLPGMVCLSVDRICSNYFGSIGMPLITIYSPLAALILKIVLNIKLVPILGVIGIAIASTICYALMLLMSLTYIRFKKGAPLESHA